VTVAVPLKVADNNRDGHMKNSNAVRHPLALQASLISTADGLWLRRPGCCRHCNDQQDDECQSNGLD
jgi:hypothetical protein